MWGSRYLSFESRGADPVRISGRLRLLEREVELELRNDGAFSLTDLRIFYPIPGALDKDFGHVEVPALAIGERRTLRAPLALSTSDTPMEPYDQLVMGLLRSDYQQRLRREQRAWVFAKVGARSHGRGIETDARLRRAAWLSVAGAPLEIDYGSRVPYGALVAYRRGGTPITTFSFALPKRYFEGGESAIERLLVRFEGRRDAELSVQAPRQGKAGRWVSMKEKAPQAAEVDGGGAFREFVLTDPAEYLEPLTGSLRFRAVVRSSARGLPRSESRLEVQVVFRR